jgi:hypothetical protein
MRQVRARSGDGRHSDQSLHDNLPSSLIDQDDALGIKQYIVVHIREARRMQDAGMTHLTLEAAIVREQITDECGIRFFDHELTAEKKTIPKHSPGISGVCG